MNQETPRKKKIIIRSVILALVFFAGGAFFQQQISTAQVPDDIALHGEDMDLLWTVWNTLEQQYPFQEPTTQDKLYAAAKGVANSYGDDYTVFLPPRDTTYFNETVSGEFGGIGAEVSLDSGYLVIVAPLEGSPAQSAGLMPGDIIIEIDGEDIVGMSLNEAISLLRGKPKTEVKLTVARIDESETLEISVTRDIVIVPIVETDIIDDTFVIQLFNFNEDSRKAFTAAIREFKTSGKEHLLIDLRNNPGGYLEAATYIASYFLPQGKVIVREDSGLKKEQEQVYRSTGHDLLHGDDIDLGILVNYGSASASEILAGALQEHEKAVILGETTFGKGSVQELIQLPQKTALKVTIAKWVTPLGEYIDQKGIVPDIVIERETEPSSEDEQLKRAIKAFKDRELDNE